VTNSRALTLYIQLHRARRRSLLASSAIGAGLIATVGITVLNDGGFDTASQSLFVALAGVALLAACALDGRALLSATRSRVALALAALAALSIASAAWTLDERVAALQAGLAIGGYAAVFVTAGALARRIGPWWFSGAVAALALIEAILGLHAVASHSLPYAERIGGVWRPGGSFEYSPALAVLQLGALPTLCSLASRRSPAIAGAAGAWAVLAGAVLGLSASRLGMAMAAALLVGMILRPPAGSSQRSPAIATAGIVALGALVAPSVLGEHDGLRAAAPGWQGLIRLAGLALVCGVAWPLGRQARALRNRILLASAACGVGLVLVLVLVMAPRAHTAERTAHGASRHTSALASHPAEFLHGRGGEWEAALQTWSEHPAFGAGAGAYFAASVRHQGSAPTLYAHDLPLELAAELGVAGLLLCVLLYTSTAAIVWRSVKGPAFWLLAPITVAFLVSNIVDWTWHLAGLGAVWAAAAGALQADGERRPRRLREVP
jgi:hypothetical protein